MAYYVKNHDNNQYLLDDPFLLAPGELYDWTRAKHHAKPFKSEEAAEAKIDELGLQNTYIIES